MKIRKRKKHPSEDAMFKMPPASANDFTGFVQQIPFDAERSEEYSHLFDVPVEKSEKKSKKNHFSSLQD